MSLWPAKLLGAGGTVRLPRRAILIYLVAIVGPTLVLLYLGLQSVERQRRAIATLSESNLRLTAERMATELARRPEQLAGLCLRDPDLASLRLPALADDRPELFRPVRRLLQQVKARHPIADLFLVLQDNRIRYPRLSEPPPRQLDEYLAQEKPTARQQFAELFEEAERLELRASRPGDAVTAYRRSAELPVSDTLRAVALARVARSARKANQPHVARQVYVVLRARYADLYDPFHRPFGLIAGLELFDLAGRGRPLSADITALANDLLRGRWELSAEQFDYYRAQIAERVDRPVVEITSAYARELTLTEALQDGLRLQRVPRTGELYPHSSPSGDQPYHAYATLSGSAPEEGHILVLAVDLNWIEQQLLPQVATDLGIDSDRVTLAPARPRGKRVPAATSVATVFPFWELSLTSADDRGQWWGEMPAFVGSTLLILAVLVLGVILLMRDASRQLQVGQLRTDFVSGVSHELKTPLTLIRLYAETLSESPRLADHERREYSDIITRESERLTHLIDRVLEFARIDRGEKQYRLVDGDVAPVVTRTVTAYADFLRRRGYAVEVALPSTLPQVRFDPDAVAAAIVNLMDNAAKYSGSAKFVGVSALVTPGDVVVTVEDRGIGISSAERPSLFGRFYRGAGSLGQGGYGLGLYLVRHIMEAHGGRVEVDSEVGQGSRFRLVFPIRAGAAEPSSIS